MRSRHRFGQELYICSCHRSAELAKRIGVTLDSLDHVQTVGVELGGYQDIVCLRFTLQYLDTRAEQSDRFMMGV